MRSVSFITPFYFFYGFVVLCVAVVIIAIIAVAQPAPKDFVRGTLEQMLTMLVREYTSLDSKVQKLAKKEGIAPEELKNEIDVWIDNAGTSYEKGLAALYRQEYQEAEEHFDESIRMKRIYL